MCADRLLNALSRARKTGPARWIACCPAHKDRTASLSIRELDDGRTLVHCFAGCPVDAVVAAVGLRIEDLFPPRPAALAGGRPPERKPYSARELLNALHIELGIVWIVLTDVAGARDLTPRDRERAAVARDRCQALIGELRGV